MNTTEGDYTTNNIESLKLLLEIHFPDSINMNLENKTEPNRIIYHTSHTRKTPKGIFTNNAVKWAISQINSFKPFKAPEGDGIVSMLL